MEIIENQIFDEERALYGKENITVRSCRFDGPADGESAFKECGGVSAVGCYFNLRYPFWHDRGVKIDSCELTELCRAALWYSENIEIRDSSLHGIKALRECRNIKIENTDIISPEFGWMSENIKLRSSRAVGEYFMFRARGLDFEGLSFKGKYSFQYIEDSTFENCDFDTKDAFWHAKRVTVRNSRVKGEYLAWYCEDVTFENCVIIGTQPLCYCKNLTLVNCEMIDCDLSFERSSVRATLTSPIVSIKNPRSGYISLPWADEIILDDPNAKCDIRLEKKEHSTV